MSLDLALIGNGTIAALVDPAGEISWGCFPRLDGDPAFCSLLRNGTENPDDKLGMFGVELVGAVKTEQEYMVNTPILVTRSYDADGGAIELTDFAPRFRQYGRMFCPMMLVRQIRRTSGNPQIRIRLRPAGAYGCERLNATNGGDHIRYLGGDVVLRLTTNVPTTAVLEEDAFHLADAATLLLGPDETVDGSVTETGRHFFDATSQHWREWVRMLAIPFEWQDAVIRAAITLQMNVFEDTGAIIAAVTTSIPEARDSTRNWDYRYCWLRDAFFVADALYRLGDAATTGRYVEFVMGIVAGARDARLAPLYTVTGGPVPEEREAKHLPGYRGMGPVRVGNQAYQQIQHDVYGEAILAALPLFTTSTLSERGDVDLFNRLELLGNHALDLFDKPDAGLWELRGTERVHTFSSVMCWAACDALAGIAGLLRLEDRATYWRTHADHVHQVITERSWNDNLGAFTAAMNGDTLDASLLLMHRLGFLAADDPRYVSTVRAIGGDLRRGEFIYRYVEKDDFGKPENAFLACTFWYIDALAAIGDRAEARRLFGHVLSCRNPHGLLAEHLDPETREQWGNFVQTYSMAGIIDSALRLSNPAS